MGRTWAIARHTIAEGIRMKIALVFVGIILLLVVGLPFSLHDEESVSTAVQTFLSFSLGSTAFVLSVLTIFLSRSFSDELAERQIFHLMTKPLPRWQFVLGKWLGIVILNTALLIGAGAGVYTAARLMVEYMSPRNEHDAARVRDEVLTARHANKVEVPDFAPMANEEFQRRREQGAYDDVVDFNPARERQRLAKELETRWRTVLPLEGRVFEFENVRCSRSAERTLQVRYKAEVWAYPPDEILRCLWIVGDANKGAQEYQVPRRDVIGRYHSISVPTDAVAPDRTLRVELHNRNPFEGEPQFANTINFSTADDIEVLFRVGTFEGNLGRQLMLVGCRLFLLAAVALAAATVFSFPVACLLTFIFFALASMSGFLTDSVSFFTEGGLYSAFQSVVQVLYAVAFFLIPDFSRYDGRNLLVDGRNVTLMWVLTGIRDLVVFGTTLVLLVACVLFQRREVAEVSI